MNIMDVIADPLVIAFAVPVLIALIAKFRFNGLEIAVILLPVSLTPQLGSTTILFGRRYKTSRRLVLSRGALIIKAAGAFLPLMLITALPVILHESSSARAFLLDALKLATVLLYMLTFAVVAHDKLARRDHRFLVTWSYVGTVVAMTGIAGSLLYDRGYETSLAEYYRATGTVNDPNSFATYLLMTIGVTLLVTHLKSGRLPLFRTIILIVGLYMSYSRAGYLIFGLMLFLIAFMAGRSQLLRRFAFLCIAPPLVYLSLNPQLLDELVNGRRELSVENDLRFVLWDFAVALAEQNPFFGVGLGQYSLHSTQTLGTQHVTHNTYLSFFAEGGVFGLTVIVMIFGLVLAAALRLQDMSSRKTMFLALSATLMMAASLNLQNFRPFWVLAGVAFAMLQVQKDQLTERGKTSLDSLPQDMTEGN